jgi:hypothetical protein
MDLYEHWDRLREQQDYFDRMRETRNDLKWRLKQDAFTRELEKSVLDAKATEREIGARRREIGEDTSPGGVNTLKSFSDEIWHRLQEILAILRKSDLPFPCKEDWIKRLNSENQEAELKVLAHEITIDRQTPASLRKFFKADLYSPSTFATAEMNLNHLGAAVCLLSTSLLRFRLYLEGI